MELTDNIVVYYKLDGNSNDSVGSNNGTDTAITYSAGNGKIVQGGGFNGSTSKILLGSNVGSFGDATFSAWIKTSGTGGQVVSDNTSGSGWALRLYLGGGNAKFILVNYGVGTNYVATSSGTVNDDAWHHIVGVRSGSTLYIYVDGSEAGTQSAVSTATTNIPLSFGAEWYASTAYDLFTGAIDEIGVWNRALSSTEVTSLYNSGNGFTYPFVSDVTITATVKDMTLAGQTANISIARTLTAITTNMVLSGKTALLSVIGWRNQAKNTSTWSNNSKNSSTWTNNTKH